MPTYGYRACGEKHCDVCEHGFELFQNISDEALDKCPMCGAPVEKVFFPPHISTGTSTKELLSDKNIKKHGFTKLVREEKGKYRKI
ncbi:MAG: zinc ribbon domain-containing protein [Planctomycetota bacterium]|nr:MAG: zinc ribbon domain-containing protein [Planctomycetota bacterium]